MAKASVKGLTVDPSAFQQAAANVAHTRSEITSLAAAAQKAGVDVGGFGSHAGEANVRVATLARETRRFFDEIRSGSGGGAVLP
jgi:hypothetical protein